MSNWINASIRIKDINIHGLKHELSEIIELCDGSWVHSSKVQYICGYLHSVDDAVHFEDLRDVLNAIIYIDQNMDNWD